MCNEVKVELPNCHTLHENTTQKYYFNIEYLVHSRAMDNFLKRFQVALGWVLSWQFSCNLLHTKLQPLFTLPVATSLILFFDKIPEFGSHGYCNRQNLVCLLKSGSDHDIQSNLSSSKKSLNIRLGNEMLYNCFLFNIKNFICTCFSRK